MVRHRRRLSAPDIAAEVRSVLLAEYRDLYPVTEGNWLYIRGQFPVSDEDGVIERFDVEIAIDLRAPMALPIVRATDKRIPATPDHHINQDGTACLGVPEEWLVVRPDATFASFMAGPVRSFFIGQALVLRGKSWPIGERAHGTTGAIDAFGELVGFSNLKQITKTIELLTKPFIGSHNLCPCGSGRKIRHCHLDRVRSAQARIAPQVAKQMLVRLGITRRKRGLRKTR